MIRVSVSEWAFPVICFAHFNNNEKSDIIVETLFVVKWFIKKNYWKPCSDGEIPNYKFSKLEVCELCNHFILHSFLQMFMSKLLFTL